MQPTKHTTTPPRSFLKEGTNSTQLNDDRAQKYKFSLFSGRQKSVAPGIEATLGHVRVVLGQRPGALAEGRYRVSGLGLCRRTKKTS